MPFQAPITLTSGAIPRNGTCPILNLSLGPIHLSLLGLNVDTSRICLQITAIKGGGLLGDLLCGIANLLNSGIPLADVLAGLTADQLTTLNNGLTQVLNQAVGRSARTIALRSGESATRRSDAANPGRPPEDRRGTNEVRVIASPAEYLELNTRKHRSDSQAVPFRL
jgi:hypothetical protein